MFKKNHSKKYQTDRLSMLKGQEKKRDAKTQLVIEMYLG